MRTLKLALLVAFVAFASHAQSTTSITSPAAGTVIQSSTQTFCWTPTAGGSQGYFLTISANPQSQGQITADLGYYFTQSNCVMATNLPLTIGHIYPTLTYYPYAGNSTQAQYWASYAVQPAGTVVVATMLSPANGIRLALGPTTFQFSSPTYMPMAFSVGSAFALGDIYANTNVTSTSLTITLPDSSWHGGLEKMYLVLYSRDAGGNWAYSRTYELLPAPAPVTVLTQLTAAAGDVVPNDYTGGSSQEPSADAPAPELVFAGSRSGVSFYPSDTFTAGIRYAAPNAPVYMESRMRTDASAPYPTGCAAAPEQCLPQYPAGSNNPDGAYCWVQQSGTYRVSWTAVNNGAPLICQIGYTDATGAFTVNGSFTGMSSNLTQFSPTPYPITYTERWWVGGTADSNNVGNFSFVVVASGQQLPRAVEKGSTMETIKSVRLPSGRTGRFHRLDLINVKPSSSTYRPGAGKKWIYDFVLDGREAFLIRVGASDELIGMPSHDSPNLQVQNGWLGLGGGWGASAFERVGNQPQRSESLKFTFESDWLPGPAPVMFQAHPSSYPGQYSFPDELPERASDDPLVRLRDEAALGEAANIANNSVRHVVIGPAIKPGATKAELEKLIRYWISDLHLAFLAPYLEGTPLDQLQPTNALERDTVDCLRRVIE